MGEIRTSQIRDRLLPTGGPPVRLSRSYELFDNAALLFGLAMLIYVPQEASVRAVYGLAAPLRFASEQTWGIALAAVGAFGVVASYGYRMGRPGLVALGYQVTVIGTSFWGACWLFGYLAYEAPTATLGSALVYFWIASRLRRSGVWGATRLGMWCDRVIGAPARGAGHALRRIAARGGRRA